MIHLRRLGIGGGINTDAGGTMKKLLALALALAIMLSTAEPVGAETPMEKMFARLKQQRAKNQGDLLVLLHGAGQAFSVANVYLIVDRRIQPMYCPPNNLRLTEINYADITIDEFDRRRFSYRDNPILSDSPTYALTYVLLEGLQRTFPCK